MREAGVDLVTLGVFSWALLEPAPGRYDFGWLDEVVERLHAGGHPRSTWPPRPRRRRRGWPHRHPETLPVTADGRTLWPGGRQAFCPSSPVYRETPLALCRRDGRALRRPRRASRCGTSATSSAATTPGATATSAPRPSAAGCARRYDDVDRAQRRVGHRLLVPALRRPSSEVLPPRSAPTFANPTQQLDFRRFCSDQLLDELRRRARRPARAVARASRSPPTSWSCARRATWTTGAGRREMDVVSNDHYLTAADPDAHVRARVQRRPDPRPRRRPAVAAHGALDQRGQLAAPQRRQAARRDAPQQPAARRARRRRGAVLPVARLPGRRGEVPLRRWSRTPARTPGCGARWSSSAPDLDAIEEVAGSARAQRRRDGVRLGGVVGRRARLPPHAATCATSTGPHDLHRALWRAASASTWCHPSADLSATGSSWCPPSTSSTTRPPTRWPAPPSAAPRCWSPTSAASSTSTTTSASAATPARSATCSACATRSSCPC